MGLGSILHTVTANEPLAVYLAGILACLLSIFWKPEVALYYIVPLIPMQTARFWLHQFPLGEKLVDFALLAVAIGLLLRAKRPIFVASPLNKILIIMIVTTYFALWQGSFFLNAPSPMSIADPRFSNWKNYVEMLLFFFLVAAAIRKPKQIVVILALMCLSILVVNRTYHNVLGGRDYSHFSYDARDAGPIGYAGENGMGAFQAEMAVFLIGLACFAKKLGWKLGLWGLACTSIYCLMFTFSRGGYVGFLAGLLVLGLLKNRKLLFVLVVILVSWQALVPNAVRERVLMTYEDGGLDQSAGDRVTLWQDAFRVITENPVVGTGFDTYEYMGRVGPFRDTHNYYVKVLVETGCVGLFLLLWFLATAGKLSWRVFKQAKDPLLSGLGCAVFATIACVAVVNLFGDRWTYLQVGGFLFVLLGLAARASLLLEEARETVPEEVSSIISVPVAGI
jgi:putative inorganic carbon (HCO3(-)) transporter